MKRFRSALLVSTAIGAAAFAQSSFAQDAAAEGAAAAADTSGQLEEVVVTATRQASTVNRVPLSVSAVSQRSLEQQGIKNVEDLSRQVPGVTFRRSGGEGNPNVTIRGIGGNAATVGAPTTGVYLDDTPLQRRNANGLITGNGSPFPQLYDLERVEILRGPQGTLYGGSCQGGTIRFITPTPSLTRYSGQARVEVNKVDDGGWGHEQGLAVGGPIIQDRIGFRASVYNQKRAGWVDSFSKYDGHQFAENINRGRAYSTRLALLFQVTDNFRITPAFYYSMDYVQDKETFRTNTPTYTVGANTVAARTFNNSGIVNGVRFEFPNVVFPQYVVPATTAFGPHTTDNGRYHTTTDVRYESSPRRTDLFLPSVTLDYDLGFMTVKSVTSFVGDITKGWDFGGGGSIRTGVLPFSITGNVAPNYLPGIPDVFGYYHFDNRRQSYTEELRFASNNPDSRFQWVGGLYYNTSEIKVHGSANWNENEVSTRLRGVPEGFFLGTDPIQAYARPGVVQPGLLPKTDVADREIDLSEREYAAFGELTFALTERLKVTGGVRVTHYKQRYLQAYGGSVAGAPPGYVGSPNFATTGIILRDPFALSPFPQDLAGCPTSAQCPLTYTDLRQKETPVSPKVGLSYQATEDNLYYATYSEGFRPGGVEPPRAAAAMRCGPRGAGDHQFAGDLQQRRGEELRSRREDASLRRPGSDQHEPVPHRLEGHPVQRSAAWLRLRLHRQRPLGPKRRHRRAGDRPYRSVHAQRQHRLQRRLLLGRRARPPADCRGSGPGDHRSRA